MSKQAILDEVAVMIRDVVGEEWIQTASITMESSFAADLELESIEIVALAEQVQARYGDEVDFPGWLGAMDLESLIGLTVGALVTRIDERASGVEAK